MTNHPAETIELELSILMRRFLAVTANGRIGSLDRSAYLLLHQISSHGSAGVKALAEEFHLDISTISRQTAALEQKGLVYRIPDPQDGRAYSLQITETGTKELALNKQARFERVADFLKNWSLEDQQQFGALLHKFNRTFVE
ncbi:MarR family winged helix-turn-helix transcriptional regulator [Paenibacillus sp. GCM10023248]|uniref:MarR family winged helix-turn-helix transcriptional regulator n=1 Tax=Bacillales TaxID=1385 RepID=UPI0023799469|nr:MULTISPECIES: MarR family transcriptional regulator [Bacillales]MDD9268178.1 MarR family transcriptional regulator [Paenibacillus sp. MAHUQ-63]MDR6879857.1 DNA-binding MarR family transcriptional regulator [Bacillus sp. 3255]